MQRLSGSVIATENAAEFSSAAKGETLQDTIRVVQSYCDVIVLRHYKPGASELASSVSNVPIINAGDGNGEHPTQALLDLYTIFSKFKKQNITITMVGDLLNGRTIHSLSFMLSLFRGIKQTFISPKALAIPNNLKNHLMKNQIDFVESEIFSGNLGETDVIYMTRIQKERFKNLKDYKKYFGRYILNRNELVNLRANSLIMHPLPRVNEIATSVDLDSRAAYFQQAQNGLYIRMALLLSIFDKL